MDKREKVERALKACTEMNCPDECPYKRDNESGYCVHNLHRDAAEVMDEEPLFVIYGESIADKIMKWLCILGTCVLTVLVIMKVAGKI